MIWGKIPDWLLPQSGFESQLEASHESSHTEKSLFNKTICPWMTIYIYDLFVTLFLDDLFDLICLHTVKWF